LNEELAEQVENRSTLRQKRESLTALYEENARKAPAWLTAQAALECDAFYAITIGERT